MFPTHSSTCPWAFYDKHSRHRTQSPDTSLQPFSQTPTRLARVAPCGWDAAARGAKSSYESTESKKPVSWRRSSGESETMSARSVKSANPHCARDKEPASPAPTYRSKYETVGSTYVWRGSLLSSDFHRSTHQRHALCSVVVSLECNAQFPKRTRRFSLSLSLSLSLSGLLLRTSVRGETTAVSSKPTLFRNTQIYIYIYLSGALGARPRAARTRACRRPSRGRRRLFAPARA